VLGGVGIVAIGIGSVMGLKAESAWSGAKASCTDYPYGCGQDSSRARSDANVATVAFVVGAAALTAGTVLWFTAPSSKGASTVGVALAPGSVQLRGVFQ
jgi:hypothetical protein